MRVRARAWVVLCEWLITAAGSSVVRKAVLIAELGIVDGLDADEYTPESWSALSSAYQAGVLVNADESATQQAVNSAASAIRSARNALVAAIACAVLLADLSYIAIGATGYLRLSNC